MKVFFSVLLMFGLLSADAQAQGSPSQAEVEAQSLYELEQELMQQERDRLQKSMQNFADSMTDEQMERLQKSYEFSEQMPEQTEEEAARLEQLYQQMENAEPGSADFMRAGTELQKHVMRNVDMEALSGLFGENVLGDVDMDNALQMYEGAADYQACVEENYGKEEAIRIMQAMMNKEYLDELNAIYKGAETYCNRGDIKGAEQYLEKKIYAFLGQNFSPSYVSVAEACAEKTGFDQYSGDFCSE